MCSSDLDDALHPHRRRLAGDADRCRNDGGHAGCLPDVCQSHEPAAVALGWAMAGVPRSEERRVGKEC